MLNLKFYNTASSPSNSAGSSRDTQPPSNTAPRSCCHCYYCPCFKKLKIYSSSSALPPLSLSKALNCSQHAFISGFHGSYCSQYTFNSPTPVVQPSKEEPCGNLQLSPFQASGRRWG